MSCRLVQNTTLDTFPCVIFRLLHVPAHQQCEQRSALATKILNVSHEECPTTFKFGKRFHEQLVSCAGGLGELDLDVWTFLVKVAEHCILHTSDIEGMNSTIKQLIRRAPNLKQPALSARCQLINRSRPDVNKFSKKAASIYELVNELVEANPYSNEVANETNRWAAAVPYAENPQLAALAKAAAAQLKMKPTDPAVQWATHRHTVLGPHLLGPTTTHSSGLLFLIEDDVDDEPILRPQAWIVAKRHRRLALMLEAEVVDLTLDSDNPATASGCIKMKKPLQRCTSLGALCNMFDLVEDQLFTIHTLTITVEWSSQPGEMFTGYFGSQKHFILDIGEEFVDHTSTAPAGPTVLPPDGRGGRGGRGRGATSSGTGPGSSASGGGRGRGRGRSRKKMESHKVIMAEESQATDLLANLDNIDEDQDVLDSTGSNVSGDHTEKDETVSNDNLSQKISSIADALHVKHATLASCASSLADEAGKALMESLEAKNDENAETETGNASLMDPDHHAKVAISAALGLNN